MKILLKLQRNKDFWFLLIISVVFFFLRFPSLFEPDWYGDEGVYQAVGMGISSGRILYRDIFDNKPPLLYLFYSFVSSNLFEIKLLSLVFGILSVLVFFLLAKKLFQNRGISFLATSLFAVLFGLPLIEGNIANAENFMLFPNILAGYLMLGYLDGKKSGKNRLFFAGLTLGLSFLIKVVAIFDFAAFFLFMFFLFNRKKVRDLLNFKTLLNEIKPFYPFISGFAAPIILVALYFLANNAFSPFITATFFSNIGYVNYGNQFIIPQGLLLLKLFILSLFVILIYKKRGLSNEFTFISLWFSFLLFGSFFSQRPYTHYLLIFLPPFCLMFGLIFLKKKFSKFALILTVLSLILVYSNFTFFNKTVNYYQNFISFITGNKSVSSYQAFFDSNTPRDYEVASFINLYAKEKDNIFVWGNNAQLYYLTEKIPPGKYTVAYHITNYKDGMSNTDKALSLKKPEFIVIMPNVPVYPFDLSNYFERANLDGVLIYEKIY